jgi:hypothetical protein
MQQLVTDPGAVDILFETGIRGTQPIGRVATAVAKEALRKKIQSIFGKEFGAYYGALELPTLGDNFFGPVINIFTAIKGTIPGTAETLDPIIQKLQTIQTSIYDAELPEDQKQNIRDFFKTINDNIGGLLPLVAGINALPIIGGKNYAGKLKATQTFLRQTMLAIDVYWVLTKDTRANLRRAESANAIANANALALRNANGRNRRIPDVNIAVALENVKRDRDSIRDELALVDALKISGAEELKAKDSNTEEQRKQKTEARNKIFRRHRILRSILQFYDTTVVKDVDFLLSVLTSPQYEIQSQDKIYIAEKVVEIEALSKKYANYSKKVAELSTLKLGENAGDDAGKEVGKVWSSLSTEFSKKLKDLKDLVDIASSDVTTFNMNNSINTFSKEKSSRIRIFDRNIDYVGTNTGNTDYQTADQANIESSDFDWFRKAQAQSCERIVSSCRGQKSFLLLHAVGSGKSRTALCVAMNTHPSLPIVCLVIKGLETAFLDELVKDYLNEDIRKSLERRMKFVTYDELDQMARKLRMNPYNTEHQQIFKNAIVLADEAHRLYPILEGTPSKADPIPYEREVIEILMESFKVIMMTATPIQKSWADFGRLINLMINLNNPLKKVIKGPNGKNLLTDENVQIIPADSEQNFRRNFARNPSMAWTLITVAYTLVFKYRKKFDEKIASLSALFGIIGNPDSIVKVVDTVINTVGFGAWQVNLTSYVPVASVSGSLLQKGMSVAQGAIVKVVAYQAAASILNFIDNAFLDRIMNPPFLPMDLDALVYRTMPYISFSDYKADEITHGILVEEFKKLSTSRTGLSIRNRLNFSGERKKARDEKLKQIKQMEIKLKDYPVLNKTQVDIPYEAIQRGLWHFLTQKGLTPTIAERHVGNLIDVTLNPKNGAITFSKPIPTSEVKELVAALRCLGNISEDNFFLDTKLVDTSDKEKLKKDFTYINDELFQRFIDNGCYIAKEKDPRIIEVYLPDEYRENFNRKADEVPGRTKWDKLNEIYGMNARKEKYYNMTDDTGMPVPFTAFSNKKYQYVMSLIIEARLKFHYLPVVYSNFDKRGMETFSAFLTSQGFNHIVLHTQGPLDIRRKRIEEAKRAYKKTSIPFTNFPSQQLIEKYILLAYEENGLKGWPDISMDERKKMIAEYQKQLEDPVCVLVHPDLQEGLDLKFNEVMICLEPMLGIGNQEQVYGRIMRSMDKNDYEEYKNTYKTTQLSNPPTSEEKIAQANEYINTWWLKGVGEEKSDKIEIVEEKVYKEMIQHDSDKRKRINKYMFQLVSTYYVRQSNDPTRYYDPQLRDWRVWSYIPILGVVGEAVAGRIDALMNLFYKNPKRIFVNPKVAFADIRGALIEEDRRFHIVAFNWIRSTIHNSLPAFDLKFIISSGMRLIIDAVTVAQGVYQTKNVRKGEAVSYVNKGSLEQDINFPTSDLYYMNEINTMDIEYTQIRRAFRLVKDDDIKTLYKIGPYNDQCDAGTQYYLDGFKDSKCKLLTGKSYSRKNVCSKVGPKLTSYTQIRRDRMVPNARTRKRKLSFTPQMKQYFTPPGTPVSTNSPFSNASSRTGDPVNGNMSPLVLPGARRNTNNWDFNINWGNEEPNTVRPLRPGLGFRGVSQDTSPREPKPGLRFRGVSQDTSPRVTEAARPPPSFRPKQEGGSHEILYKNDPVPNPLNIQEIQASPIFTANEKQKAVEDATRMQKEFQEGLQKFAEYFQKNPQALTNSKVNSLIGYNNPLSSINTSLFQEGGKRRKTRYAKKVKKHQSRKQRR